MVTDTQLWAEKIRHVSGDEQWKMRHLVQYKGLGTFLATGTADGDAGLLVH